MDIMLILALIVIILLLVRKNLALRKWAHRGDTLREDAMQTAFNGLEVHCKLARLNDELQHRIDELEDQIYQEEVRKDLLHHIK